MKILKKISKGFLFTILFLVFLVAVCYVMIRSRPFQNWAAQKAVNYLSNELKTRVSLKSIDFELINTLVLEGLYIEDREGDTLGYFGKLKVNFNYKMLFDNKLQLARIKRVEIEDTKLNFLFHPKSDDLNFQFLIDYFSPPRKSTGKFVPFKLIVNYLELKNVDFRYRLMDEPAVTGRRFDESFMEFRGIHAFLKPFKLIGDSLNFDITGLTFRERSGFKLNELSAKTIISSTTMEFDQLILKTPYSKVSNYLKYTYRGYEKFSDFIDSVEWDVNLSKSVIGIKDVAYFSDELRKYSFPITATGRVKGTLAKMEGLGMEIKVDKINRFRGDIKLKDITETEKLSFDLNIFELVANPSSLQDIMKTKFPEELLRIGSVKYYGTLTGRIKDFETKGLLESTIGKIRTDLSLKFPEGKPEEYEGEIEVYSLNTGKLFNNSDIGNLSFYATLDGQGFNLEDLNTAMDGKITSFDYGGYTYQNITVDGVFKKKLFNGKFDIKDPNVTMSMVGMFDLNKEKPTGDFNAVLGEVNLEKLGYGDINIKQVTGLKIEFEGFDVDEIKLNATINNLVLEKGDTIYRLGDILIVADGPLKDRYVTMQSDLGNANIKGEFKMSRLNLIANNILHDLFPDYYAHLKGIKEPVDVKFDIDIPDSKFISGLFLPDFHFRKFTMNGIYNSHNQNMDVIAHAENFKYLNYNLSEVSLESVKKPGERMGLNVNTKGFYIKDSLVTDKLTLKADLGGNDINFRLNAADSTHDLSIKLGGNIAFERKAIDFKLTQSAVFIYNKAWLINDSNHFRYSNSQLQVDNFSIANGNQSIAVSGLTGDRTFNKLNLSFHNFHLEEANPILTKWGVQLEGTTNGRVLLNGSNNAPVVESGIMIDNLKYNGDSIGDVWLNSVADEGNYKMAIDGKIKNGLINDLLVTGKIDVTPGNEKIDILLTLKESNIKPFGIFTEGLFSHVEGLATARLMVKGPLGSPDINGKINVKQVSLYMDYLGLPLKIEKVEIEIDEKKIDLGTFQVADKYGSKALAGGKILHKNFGDLRFDIFMKNMKNFNAMDIAEYQNDLFTGVAFVDGNITVKGSLDQIYLNINAKSRPKTEISLPLSGTTENAGPDFIEVVDLRADKVTLLEKKLSGITMDFDFEVTQDAEIKLIFDAKFNDVIRATGNGSIKMELNTFGDFYMYGRYTMATGSYNFTALNNLVNKNLRVKPGGTIIWNGNPYDALVNIVATTTINADPTVILPVSSSSATGSSSKVAVDCEIMMKEKLFSPQIKLGVDLSKDNQSTLFANADLSNAMNQIKSDQDETNKQFINLIVFNSFAPLYAGGSNATGENALNSFENSMGQLITNQLNNWLSQIDPNWELGLDYQNASNSDANQRIMVSLKRKLYKDRIEIGGAYGQAGNTSYDLNVSYKITKDGRWLGRAFNKKANDPRSVNTTTINTSGLGFYYRNERDYLFPKLRKWLYNKRHD